MNSVILCEGASDAILLSYYLIHCGNWEYTSDDGPFSVNLVNVENQEFNWYKRGEEFVALWGVGGKGQFQNAINQLSEINRSTEKGHGAQRIFILCDRDTEISGQTIIDHINCYFSNAGIHISVEDRAWKVAHCKDAFQDDQEIHVGIVIVPFERSGALETFILDALAENDEDRQIIDAVRGLIADMKENRYLTHERDRVKAELAATLGIMHPTRSFRPINSMLSNINWEQYQTIQAGFAL